MGRKIVWCLVVLTAMSLQISAQRHYVCYYAAQRPVIDGSGDDPAWQQAPWTEDFADIEGEVRPQPPLRTRVKMLWDTANLYIYAELQEPDLWGTLRQHDTIIYDDNDFEVFINPDNTTHRYFELEINSLGTVMDLFMNKPYRNGGKALMSWDAQGLQSAVATRGTLNHPGDVDDGWSVEMAIPLKTLSFYGDRSVTDSTQWRINFSRVEWDRDVKDGAYRVRTDAASGRRLPEHNWVWSPQGYIDMHMPEKWGYLQFSKHNGGKDTVTVVEPADEGSREILWTIYYKQQKYFREHGHYADILRQLDLVGGNGIRLKATDTQFTAAVNTAAGELSIDQDGEVKNAR
ncbi:MAG TPA: carbohydrate-binding family 9-like protein [Puia sp.]|nr:carbohydrate-binding family 9-like protein [Puia sp.]